MKTRVITLILVLIALGFAPAAPAQSVHFDLGLGYQLLDESGNEDVFRTQTGEKEGWLLDSLTVTATGGADGLFDRLRVDAAGIGASPDTRVRIRVDRAGTFALSLNYMRADVLTALPNFANPLLGAGVIPGQHTLNRRRDAFDLDLELMPGKAFTPLLGYSRHTYSGSGRTTFHFGEDEFALGSDLDETVNEYRLGFTVALAGWRATVMQGWRSTDSSLDYALAVGAGGGNNSRPVLGRDVLATVLGGHSRTTGNAPYTNVQITGNVAGRVRLVGSYARLSGAEADTDDSFSATGQFASFALQRFFSGALDAAGSHAEATSWRGEARAEVTITNWLDLIGTFSSSHRSLDGEALLRTGYLNTVNFSGADPKNLTTLLSAVTAWDRDDEMLEGKLVARPLAWLRLWAAGGTVEEDVTITPDAAEIVVPGGQGGAFERGIDRLSAGADVELGPVALAADWLSDDADAAVVHADYLDRERLRARATVKIGSVVRLLGTGEWIDLSNPTPGIEYDAEVEHLAAALEVMPIAALTIHAGYDTYTSDSTVLVRAPQDFTTAPSIYAEDGENVEGSVSLKLDRFLVEVGANRYSNEGDFAFDLDRTFARFDVDINESIGVYGQWESREYTESELALADYSSDRYGLFLRWSSK